MYGVLALVGISSIAAPFLFGYSENIGALWTNLVIGLALFAIAIFERVVEDQEPWEYWIAGFLGVIAMGAPFILRYYNETFPTLITLTIGTITIMTAGYRLFSGNPPKRISF